MQPQMRIRLALLLVICGCGGTAEIELDGDGGEAWTFAMPVAGRVNGDCEILLESPRGRVVAARAGDRFTGVVPLAPGSNQVRARCGDAISAAQTWDVRLVDRPTARARVHIGDGELVLDGGGSEPAEISAAPLVTWQWQTPDGPRTGESVTLPVPAADGDYRVALHVVDADGAEDRAVALFRVSQGEPLLVDPLDEHPAWVDAATVYGVVPFFFAGGGFAGVRDRLDEIAELGATVLWLSPVTSCPDDDFGYATTDHFALRPHFGDEAELRALIADAHGLGLRVILDFVPNHTSAQHLYVEQRPLLYDQEELHYFDWEHLWNLDYDQPEVRRMMIEAFAHWVRNYDVDGFRVDVAWGVAERRPDFWPEWRRELTRIEPELLLVAEGSARDPYWFDHGFDAAYDWTWELGEWAWVNAFDAADVAAALRDALTAGGEGFDPDVLIFRFLDNNDTGERFVTRHGPGMTRVAAAMLLTLPGLPVVYTGSEVGAEFLPYHEGPPLDWVDTHGLRPHWTRLIELRRSLQALHGRDLILLDAGARNVLAYWRPGDDPVLVVLNFGAAPVSVNVAGQQLELAAHGFYIAGDGEIYAANRAPGRRRPAACESDRCGSRSSARARSVSAQIAWPKR